LDNLVQSSNVTQHTWGKRRLYATVHLDLYSRAVCGKVGRSGRCRRTEQYFHLHKAIVNAHQLRYGAQRNSPFATVGSECTQRASQAVWYAIGSSGHHAGGY
jgi:hypothetical protein